MLINCWRGYMHKIWDSNLLQELPFKCQFHARIANLFIVWWNESISSKMPLTFPLTKKNNHGKKSHFNFIVFNPILWAAGGWSWKPIFSYLLMTKSHLATVWFLVFIKYRENNIRIRTIIEKQTEMFESLDLKGTSFYSEVFKIFDCLLFSLLLIYCLATT